MSARRRWLVAALVVAACAAGVVAAAGRGGLLGAPAARSSPPALTVHWASLEPLTAVGGPWLTDARGAPVWPAPGSAETWVRRLLFPGLEQVGPGGRMIPALAASHEVEQDGLVHRFRLRPEAHFSDGRRVLGADVLASLRALLRLRPDLQQVVQSLRIDAAGDVVLVLRRPDGAVVRALAGHGVVARDAGVGTAVGAGPFRLAGSRPGRWLLERVAGRPAPAGGTGAARIDLAVTRPDALPELLARGVPLISGVSGAQVAAHAAAIEAAGLTATPLSGGWRLMALLNPLRPPLDEPALRAALAGAVDRQALAGVLGDARPVAGSGQPAASLDQTLAAAGYRLQDGTWRDEDGRPLHLEVAAAADGLWSLPGVDAAAVAETLAAGLRRLGLEVAVRLEEPDVFLADVYEFRHYDLALLPAAVDDGGAPVGLEALLGPPGLPPLPGAADGAGALVPLAEPVVWVLHRLEGTGLQVDAVAGLFWAGPERQERRD